MLAVVAVATLVVVALHSCAVEALSRALLQASTRPSVSGDDACTPATAHVAELQRSHWPHEKGPAPLIKKLVYLNLNESKDRRKSIERQVMDLQRSGSMFEVERFQALTADQVKSESRFAAWRRRGFSALAFPIMKKHWGTAANMLSKYTALKQLALAANETSDLVMLLEDDVVISPNFQERWKELWPYVPDDWDLLRVGGFKYAGRNCSQYVNKHVDRAAWYDPPPSGPCHYCGSQAYVVRPGRLSRVLQRVEKLKFVLADIAFGAATPPLEDPSEAPPLNIFSVKPFLVFEDPRFGSVRDLVDERSG